MVELDERVRKLAELSGQEPDVLHQKSVLLGFMDDETLKHTAHHQTTSNTRDDLVKFKNEVNRFVTMVDVSHKRDKLNALVEDTSAEDWLEEWPEDGGAEQGGDEAKEEEYEKLHKFQGNCYNCGGYGHASRECPSERKAGKGKGKSKGGKPKGSGQPKSGPKSGVKGAGKGGTKGSGKSQVGKGKGGACWTCGSSQHYSFD